jgi:hypothetical protein
LAFVEIPSAGVVHIPIGTRVFTGRAFSVEIFNSTRVPPALYPAASLAAFGFVENPSGGGVQIMFGTRVGTGRAFGVEIFSNTRGSPALAPAGGSDAGCEQRCDNDFPEHRSTSKSRLRGGLAVFMPRL